MKISVILKKNPIVLFTSSILVRLHNYPSTINAQKKKKKLKVMRGCASLISQSTQFPSGAKVGKRKICKGIFGRRRGRGDRPEKKEEEETEEIGVRE